MTKFQENEIRIDNASGVWTLGFFAVDRVLAGTVFNVKPNLQKQVMQQLSITCKVMVD